MPFTRLYTGSDGQSHIEEMDPATHPTLQELEAATGISFSIAQPGRFSDWHNAPRRQYVITLSGEGEIGLGDGSVHKFGPGHVSLVEDLNRAGAYHPDFQRRAPYYGDGAAGGPDAARLGRRTFRQ